MEREHALVDLEVAREEWQRALAKVPDEALGFLKSGDDYAIGGLLIHVNWVLVHYDRVLKQLVDGGFAPFTASDPDGEVAEVNRRAKVGLSAAERPNEQALMDGLHAGVVKTIRALAESDWGRKAPVVYGSGDPYDTSPEDIVGWLRDHYREHVTQSADLVEAWRNPQS